MKTFGYGCGFPEQLVAEWASHACYNCVPSHFDHLIRHAASPSLLARTHSLLLHAMLCYHRAGTSRIYVHFDAIKLCIKNTNAQCEKEKEEASERGEWIEVLVMVAIGGDG